MEPRLQLNTSLLYVRILPFVDTKGNILAPSEDGSQPKKDIPGYKIVETKVDEKAMWSTFMRRLRPVIRIRKAMTFQVIQAKTANNLRKIFQVTAS